MKKKYRIKIAPLLACIVVLAFFMVVTYSTYRYLELEHFRFEAKKTIATELNVPYESGQQLDESLLMWVRYYSSSKYEDVRISILNPETNKFEVVYNKEAADILTYGEKSNEYVQYFKILKVIDDYISAKENASIAVYLGMLSFKIFLIILNLILFCGVIILLSYFMACKLCNEILPLAFFLKRFSTGIKKIIFDFFY